MIVKGDSSEIKVNDELHFELHCYILQTLETYFI